MFCKTNEGSKKSCCAFGVIFILAILLMLLKPAEWLMHKPANADEHYAPGWSEGCASGANAASPLGALFADKPFVQQVNGKEAYRSAWNDGFTLCRFSQSAFQEWGQFFLLLAALIAIRCRCGTNASNV